MCTYLARRGATYYFRRAIPVELRPAFGGRAEFMLSLRSKDRAEATLRIPAHTPHWRNDKLCNGRIDRQSVELITKADVMAYRRQLFADPKRSQINVRDAFPDTPWTAFTTGFHPYG